MIIQKIKHVSIRVCLHVVLRVSWFSERFMAAARMLPKAPTAAASEMLAIPVRIEPSTLIINNTGKISPVLKLNY